MKTKVFELNIKLTNMDVNKHLPYSFILPCDADKLEIVYSYYPKKYEDKEDSVRLIKDCYRRYGLEATREQIVAELPLNNLITISLDDESGTRGNAHRHNNNAIYYIGKEDSSEGFVSGKINKGKWTVTLSTHCILSKKVDVNIEVYADEE